MLLLLRMVPNIDSVVLEELGPVLSGEGLCAVAVWEQIQLNNSIKFVCFPYFNGLFEEITVLRRYGNSLILGS